LLASDGFSTMHKIEVARWLADQGAPREPEHHGSRHRPAR
jgi:hypothetical protein